MLLYCVTCNLGDYGTYSTLAMVKDTVNFELSTMLGPSSTPYMRYDRMSTVAARAKVRNPNSTICMLHK